MAVVGARAVGVGSQAAGGGSQAAGVEEGLKQTSCVNLCNLFTIHKRQLRTFVGTVGPETMEKVRRALMIASGCA